MINSYVFSEYFAQLPLTSQSVIMQWVKKKKKYTHTHTSLQRNNIKTNKTQLSLSPSLVPKSDQDPYYIYEQPQHQKELSHQSDKWQKEKPIALCVIHLK